MTASIAHEINQPLGAIVNSASACLRWLEAQKLEEARRSASRVIAEGHRASEIIGRIRALAKKAPLRKDWLDVNETIHEVIALARSEVQRNGVALETQLSDDVPVVLADRIHLQQVILNLMMNAIEAMSGAGEGPRELLVRSGTDETQGVLVSVQDSGPGLDPKSLEHLFDAFYTTKPQGLGMGLAISRSIIEAHGGRLWATANAPPAPSFSSRCGWWREGVMTEPPWYSSLMMSLAARALKDLIRSVGLRVETFASAREFLRRAPGCARLPGARCALAGLSGLDLQRGWPRPNPHPDHLHHGSRRHPDDGARHEGRSGGVSRQTLPRPGNARRHPAGPGARPRGTRAAGGDGRTAPGFDSLTPRERDVFGLVVAGLLNKQIAAELGTSEITIKRHRSQVMSKMRATSLADLVRIADKLGLPSPK